MKIRKTLALVLALVMAVSMMAVGATAAEITTAGSTGEVPVKLTVAGATFSVTVPTELPISVAADGTYTYADNAKIVNNSKGQVKVTNVAVSGVGDWEIVGYDAADMTKEKVGAHKIALQINGEKTTADDTITFEAGNWTVMDGVNATASDELPITYDAKVAPQSSELTGESVVTVVFTIGWNS